MLGKIVDVMKERGSSRLDAERIDRVRIIPTSILRFNGLELDIRDNEIYLSPEDALLVSVLMCQYFISEGCRDQLKCVLNHLEYLSWDARRCLVSTGDVS